ncbi:hypothetical protein [Nocardia asiatica]|uniref:hypothetical protein n=1 Tax=Nocardia asiatica TaxID=209252 RepID=UPI0005C236F1|nr:hypothetical protein [Nocardia asiatica]
MDPRTEDRMRTEFATLVAVTGQLRRQPSEAKRAELVEQRDRIDRWWRCSPHATRWGELVDACHDWTVMAPDMARMLDGLEHAPAGGINEVTLRSLRQARILTGNGLTGNGLTAPTGSRA